jgi:PAS domain S-box-containing protein
MRRRLRTLTNLVEFARPEGLSSQSSRGYWNTATTPLRPSQPLRDANCAKVTSFASSVDTVERVEDVGRALHQAKSNFGTIFDTSPAILSIIQLKSRRYREINNTYERCTGYSRTEVLGKPSIALGLWSNIEERERVFQKLAVEGSIHAQPGTFQTKGGKPLKALLSARVIEFGSEMCALVAADDITVCQQAEEERLQLIQRLINAQEVERTRVARELHDNIGQSLALFCMDLEATRLALKLPADRDERLKRLCGRIKDLGHVVGNLSHQLHSAELEWLGLAAAIRGLCREFSEQHNIKAECVCTSIPDNLNADVSLGLFRVTQEALHNIAKHSQARSIAVEIHRSHNALTLSISDDGIGFPANKSLRKRGLGLTSMHERMLLAGGTLTITSKPGAGTRIEAIVPIQEPKVDTF